MISPVVGHGEGDRRDQPREFVSEHNPAALSLRVSTAARLSATFPYVSPISRPDKIRGLAPSERYHVADGGYVDNEGAFTVVDWIDRLLAYYRQRPLHERPFDRILVVRIQPFPIDSLPQPELGGPVLAAFGPARAILEVRVASQLERNRRVLEMLREFVERQASAGDMALAPAAPAVSLPGRAPERPNARTTSRAGADTRLKREHARVDRERAKTDAWVHGMQSRSTHNLAAQQTLSNPRRLPPVKPPEDNARPDAERPQSGAGPQPSTGSAAEQEPLGPHLPDPELEVDWVDIVFQPGENYAAPLSWKLTQRQQKQIDDAWSRITGRTNGHWEKTPLIEKLEAYFGAANMTRGHAQQNR